MANDESQVQLPSSDVAVEIARYLNELGDPQTVTTKLFRSKPTVLPNGTKCSGFLSDITSPEQLQEERVREEFGGGDFYVCVYQVGHKGARKRIHFDLAGAPRIPAHLLDQRAANAADKAGANGNGHAGDAAMGLRALDAGIKDSERHAREREDRDKEIRRLIQEGAEAKARAAALETAMAELKARPAEMLAIKTVKKDMTAIALTTIQQAARDQAEAHAREMAALRAAKHEESAPMRQYLQDVAKQQDQSLTALGAQYKLMMDMQQAQSNMMMDMLRSQNENNRAIMQQQIDSMKSDLREMRASRDTGILGDFDKLASAVEKLRKISGNLESEPKDMGSQIVSVLGALIENAPDFVKSLKMNPGAPGAQQLSPQQQQAAHQEQHQKQAESDKEAALLLQTLRDAYVRKMPVEDVARTVAGRIGSGGVASLLSQPADTLVAAIQSQVPELSSPEGGQYLRELRTALTLL